MRARTRHRAARRAGRRRCRNGGRTPLRAVRAAGRAGPRRRGGGGRARLLECCSPRPIAFAPMSALRHCGGCALQHLDEGAMRAWKREQVRVAFAQRGMAADVAPTVAITGGRRRAVFAARRRGSGVVLGFHAARGHEIVGLAECPVLVPEIVAALPALVRLAEPVLPREAEARIIVLAADNGLDVAVEDTPAGWGEARARLARAAAAAGVLRVSIGGEPVYAAGVPLLRFGRPSWSRRRAPSCRRWRRRRRRSPRACSACCRRRRSASPISSAASAPSPSRSRAAPRCWPSTATVRPWRRLRRRSGARRGQAHRDARARPLPRAVGPHAGWRASMPSCSIRRGRALRRRRRDWPPPRSRSWSRCRATRPRSRGMPAARRRRLSPGQRHAHRPVPVLGPCRGRGGVSPLGHQALKLGH